MKPSAKDQANAKIKEAKKIIYVSLGSIAFWSAVTATGQCAAWIGVTTITLCAVSAAMRIWSIRKTREALASPLMYLIEMQNALGPLATAKKDS